MDRKDEIEELIGLTPEQLLKMWNDFKIKPLTQIIDKDGNKVGKLFIVGTMGSDNDNLDALKEMFYIPTNHNIIPYPTFWDIDYKFFMSKSEDKDD